MIHRTLSIGPVVLLVCLTFANTTRAQALVERVPEDAVFYLGWRGGESMGQAYEQSNLKALLDATDLRAIFNQTIPAALNKGMKMGDKDAADVIGAFQTLAPPLWKYPTAIYVAVDTNDQMPMPHAALFCKAGKDALAMQQKMDELLSRIPEQPPIPMKSFVIDDIVGIEVGYDEPAMALVGTPDNKAKPLSADRAFANALAKVGGDPVVCFYYDTEGWLKHVDQMILRSNENELIERWPKIKEASGLSGMKRLIVSAGFDGKDWAERVFNECPAPRKGLFAALDCNPVPTEMLKQVPQSATMMAAGAFDPAKLLTEMRTALGEVDPDFQVKFDQAMGAAKMYIFGKDLIKDVLEPLGEHWVVYNDPELSGGGMLGAVIINQLDDPAKAQQGLASLSAALNNTMAAAMKNAPVKLSIKQVKTRTGDVTINYIAMPLLTPSWAIKDGKLYAAMFPQIVEAAVLRGAPAKSILDNPEFIALQKRLGEQKFQSISFVDLPKSAPQSYPMLLMATRTVSGLAEMWDLPVPAMALPRLEVLMKYVSPMGGESWSDEQGFYYKSVSPFPGASLLEGPQLLGPLMLAGPAIAAASARAQESRQQGARAAQASRTPGNLQQIGLGVQQYANDHNGDAPPDLAAVLPYVKNDAKKFLSPSADKSKQVQPPQDPAALKDWVNNDSDYQYIAGGKNLNLQHLDKPASQVVIAHVKFDRVQNDRAGVLFADGHVQIMTVAEAQKKVEGQ
jgi:prepilin-type processing-associated H-X9-DG protein